ncbi:DUF305 domain-containing protein [Mycobacterium sp. 4D054]|uniref:DUF305 domain-containing protein n=1 Tax=unclassified Mycobacterium TaxID=2642494 RepID=UPI0021B23045|nr:DUF305 domain-containing protein [Mycobacterium sp. SMC-8]UXA10796.1 DUF305 domain-containing protein [Mycobacterium sp. SMC-8]
MGALAAMTVVASCGNSADNQAQEAPASPTTSQTAGAAPVAAHNHADMMFARHMIPHHQQAIEMSDMILGKQDIDPRVAHLARQIKDAQGPEIETMQSWLDQWGMAGMDGMPGHSTMPGMAGMDGMMSPAQMQALQNAQGAEAAKLFLTGMITHHQGAIAMAENEIQNGQFPDTVALAESIKTSQQKEIDTMNDLLDSF